MDTEQPGRCLPAHRLNDASAPISALRNVARVPQAFHEDVPCAADALGSPAHVRRSLRESKSRQRWNHHVEGVLRAAAMLRRIGEWADELDLLEHGARPAVR